MNDLWKLDGNEQTELHDFIQQLSELDDPISKQTLVIIETLQNAHEEALDKIYEQEEVIKRLNDYIDDWT